MTARHDGATAATKAMPSYSIIDSHVHLWPASKANEQGHAWMTPGMPLAREHLLADYWRACRRAASNTIVEGVVYVETDARYTQPSGAVSEWATGPLDEIRFLTSIVEGSYGEQDSKNMLAIVAWAPMDQPPAVLEEWLRLAEDVAGTDTWRRVKGFRFLLQGIHDQREFEALVFSSNFINNLRTLGKRGFSFDIGVDQRSGGVWQLEAIAKAMALAHSNVPDPSKTIFILNHLCKPDFCKDGADYVRWRRAIETISRCPTAYMKLSGAFSELPQAIGSAREIAQYMKPWTWHAFICFGANRIMFGSDWPVCNIKGPQQDAWTPWKHVVEAIMDDPDYKLTDGDRAHVWKDTAVEAYRLV